MAMDATLRREVTALRRFAGEIGGDATLIQGAGGNVSIKSGSTMWIKASGTWLAHAVADQIMVPVALLPQHGGGFLAGEVLGGDLRPSIETSMHAALPQAVVVHVHSVDTIALAVRTDAMQQLSERLDGLRWAFVPYRRPGRPLTDAIVAATWRCPADVLVLANHGLVIAAADVAAARTLLQQVVGRLRLPVRHTPAGNFSIAAPGYRLPADPIAHAIAIDPLSTALAERGALYPDHVVFLGAPRVIDDLAQLRHFAATLHEGQPRPTWLLIRGCGVALSTAALRGSDAMLRCLADVAARIPRGAAVNVLDDGDVADLLDWDAERYRRNVAGR